MKTSYRFFWYAALSWLIAVTWLSTRGGVSLPKFSLFSADKLAHAASYALLTILVALAWSRQSGPLNRAKLTGIFLFSSVYGALMEWVQDNYFPDRFFEYDDMLANMFGALLAIIFWRNPRISA